MTDHWHTRFLDLARHIATWSKDPSTRAPSVRSMTLRLASPCRHRGVEPALAKYLHNITARV